MDLREAVDTLRDRWEFRRPLSERARDGCDAAVDRWAGLSVPSRVGVAGVGAVAVGGLGLVAFLVVEPSLHSPQVTSTTTTVSTEPSSTTTVALSDLLQTPETVGSSTTLPAIPLLPPDSSPTGSRSTQTTQAPATTKAPTPTTRRPPAPTTRPTSPPTTRPSTTRPPTTPPTTSPPPTGGPPAT